MAYRGSKWVLDRLDDGDRGDEVYINDGDDSTDHELKIEVDGHEYTATETESYNHDGVLDTAVVDDSDGGHIAFTDTDHDGEADLATKYDSHGDVVDQAHFDPTTGQWTETGATPTNHSPNQGGASGSGETITVDTDHGDRTIGPATADFNDDGKPDTAITTDDDGNTWAYTDMDGDGKADYSLEVTAGGDVTISEHTGEHQWTTVEHGHIDSSGHYHKDGGASGADGSGSTPMSADDRHWGDDSDVDNPLSDAGAATVVRTDSVTGEWR